MDKKPNSLPLSLNKSPRESNLELFRIIVMLLIVAHHYVVNSEVLVLMRSGRINAPAIFFNIFGAWGKTGINCFVLITGYFMCVSRITLRKYAKLYLEIKFYQYVIWAVFVALGLSSFSYKWLFLGLLPFSKIGDSFTNAFMAFYLFIPFLNLLVESMNKRQHLLLLGLLLWIYTFLAMLKLTTYNYVSWFVTLYFVASYIRFYGLPHNDSTWFWGVVALIVLTLSVASIFIPTAIGKNPSYSFVSDSNAVFALLLSVSAFMFFKNLKMGHSRLINAIGGTTFGVFLIHTRGEEMRHWLWYNLVDCGGHYEVKFFWLYAIAVVLSVFIICSLIDWLRITCLEKWVFRKLDPLFVRIENKWKLPDNK